MSRTRLCEVLSSLANCPITEHEFIISEPVIVDGVVTTVMVQPRNKTRRYGFQQVEYKRFDLSERPALILDWRGEQSTHDLAKRASLISHFPYRLPAFFGATASRPRRLRLQAEDVVYEPIFANTNLTKVTLRAVDKSDFFIGSWDVTLRRTT